MWILVNRFTTPRIWEVNGKTKKIVYDEVK